MYVNTTYIFLPGLGKFEYLLVLACGLIYVSCGYQNGLSSYIIPVAQCDLHMTSEDKGFLNAIFLIGTLELETF